MQDSSKWQLILASASPRRRELLAHTGVPFIVKVSQVEELSQETDPALFALDVARQKGRAVTALISEARRVVVAADTVVATDHKIYGKPRNVSEAQSYLQELAGRTHDVHTAVVIAVRAGNDWLELTHIETTEVDFAPLDRHWLEAYLATGDSLDKAGAYGIQGQALRQITAIRGCYANVVGFPLARFCAMMEKQFQTEMGMTCSWQKLF